MAIARPRATIAVWLAVSVVLAVLGLGVDKHLTPTGITVPGTGSGIAQELRDDAFGAATTASVMLEGPPRQVVRQGRRMVRELRRRPGTSVVSPFERRPGASALRPEPRIALVVVETRLLDRRPFEVSQDLERAVDPLVSPPVSASLTGEAVIGRALSAASVEAIKKAELVALPVLALVLLAIFRSPIAAALPGAFGAVIVLSGLGVIRLLTEVVDLDATATSLLSMMGLALGVDYSLLMVARFREAIRDGLPPGAVAARATAASAGRTVLFAGAVLGAAMVSMIVLSPGAVLVSGAIGVAAVTAMSVFTALLVVPAALTLLGPNLDRWRLGGHGGRRRALPALLAAVARRPRLAAALATATILGVAAPTLALATGAPTVALLPADDAARQDFERVTDRFGAGWSGPFGVPLLEDVGVEEA